MTNLQWAIHEEYAEGQQRRISPWYSLEEAERKLAAIIHEDDRPPQPYLLCKAVTGEEPE